MTRDQHETVVYNLEMTEILTLEEKKENTLRETYQDQKCGYFVGCNIFNSHSSHCQELVNEKLHMYRKNGFQQYEKSIVSF